MQSYRRSLRVAGIAATKLFSTAQALLALVGLSALLVVLLPAPREYALQRVAAMGQPAEAPGAPAVFAGTIQPGDSEAALEREQRAVSEFIAKRYRVSDQAVSAFVSTSYRAGRELSLDPLLILAVMAVESRYNPVAESGVGAKGLMQVIPRYHLDKLLGHGGEQALLDPDVNIVVGAQILREYMRRFGDLEAALQMYGGALDEPSAQYAAKVLAEKARLDILRHKARKQNA